MDSIFDRRSPRRCRAARPLALQLGLVLFLTLASVSAAEHTDRLVVHSWSADDGIGQVDDLAQTPDGYLWAATSAGLVRFDGNDFVTFVPTGQGPTARDPVMAVSRDPSGYLATGAASGAYRFDGGRFRPTTRPGHGGRPWPATRLLTDRDGAVWIAAPDSLLHLEPGTSSLRMGLPGVTPHLLYEDPYRHLWVATDSGHLYRRLGNAFHPVNLPPDFGDAQVRCMALQVAEELLIGRSDGLWRLTGDFARGGLPRQASPVLGLSSTEVEACLEDGDGGLWIATADLGLVHRSADGATSARAEVGAGTKAMLLDQAGDLWVGGSGGLTLLADPSNEAPLPVALLATVEVDGEPRPPTRRISAEADVDQIRLGLTAPSFRADDQVAFRMRRGTDDWRLLDAPEVVLDDPPAGRTELTIQAGLDDRWQEPGTKVTIDRARRLWQTQSFWGALGAAGAAVATWLLYLFWSGPVIPLEDDEEIDDDSVHLEDLDTDELRVDPRSGPRRIEPLDRGKR